MSEEQLVIILRDVTVEKTLQREKAMNKYAEIMFASTSHELRTPINVMINCINCIEGNVERRD
jgi:signal transduction histidine kinase